MPEVPDSRLARSFLPSVGVLELTFACNHRCLFCSCPWEDGRPASGSPRFERGPELDLDAWRHCLRMLCERGVSTFAFTGGEPTLKPGFEELLRHAASLEVEHVEIRDGRLVSRVGPPRLHLLSNGTALTGAHLDLLATLGAQLSVSLPGLSTFHAHTGADPRVILAVLAEACRRAIPTTLAVTVTRWNLPELYETLAAGLLAGADALLLNRFLPGGRGLAHQEALTLEGDQVVEMLEVAERVLVTANRRGSVGTEIPRCLLGDRVFRNLRVGTRCSAATGFFVVDPSGRLRACNHSPVQLMRFEDMDGARTHPYWMRFVRKDWMPAECRGCSALGRCDGGCREAAHILGGRLDAPDPSMRGPLPASG
jgi:radical SAM protein with 4Fe4S-binding SPASM domain